jgi:enterochelin esterase family protein
MDQAVGAAGRTDTMAFRLADPDRRLVGVRLVQEVGIPGELLDFGYDESGRAWRLSLPRPPVWRLEYRLELRHPDGRTEQVCDSGNPRRVGGAFGDKSVLEFPDYREPGWLRLSATTPGTWRELVIPVPPVKGRLTARIWSPATPTEHILVAHDGPEYDKLGALGHYSAALVGSGAVPAHHLVLLAPGDRDEWYSANPGYAWALVADVLPRVYAVLGAGGPVIGMGVSLGGLAMLHAQRRYPAAFAALFLQSGSFFVPRLDRQESGFRRYLRIVRFTGKLHRGDDRAPPVPAVLTCGLSEENLSNNREMAATLARQGYPTRLAEVPDAHNFTGWRDALDPYLTELLRHVWG